MPNPKIGNCSRNAPNYGAAFLGFGVRDARRKDVVKDRSKPIVADQAASSVSAAGIMPSAWR